MLMRFATLMMVSFLLTACITETRGRVPAEPDENEAAQINMELGVTYIRQGDYEKARSKLEKAVEQDPDNSTAHRALGLVYQRLGDYKLAEKSYRRALRADSRDTDALNDLGVFLCVDGGQPEEGLDYLDRALDDKLYPGREMLNLNAGLCVKDEDPARAETYFRDALAANPRATVLLYHLADVTHQQNNDFQARAFLERFLQAGGRTPEALLLGVEIEQSMGDFGKADAYARELKQRYPESVETGILIQRERGQG